MPAFNPRRQLAWENGLKLFFFVSLILAILCTLMFVQDLLPSAVIALVISYLLIPFVNKLESAGMTRLQSTTLVFIGFTMALVGVFYLLTPFISNQAAALQTELPKYIDGTVALVRRFQNELRELSGGALVMDFGGNFRVWLENQSHELLSNLPGYLTSSAAVVVMSPFIAFFLLKDGRMLSQKLLHLAPNNIFELALNLHYQISLQIGQYFRARLLEALIVGAVVFLGLLSIQFPYAAVMALFAAVTNLIPYIGPVVGAIPALVIALTNQGSGVLLFLVISVYLIAQLIDVIFIIPLVVAKIVDLHPVTVVIAVIVGAQLLGVLGMVISIPIFSAAKVTFSTVYKHVTNSG